MRGICNNFSISQVERYIKLWYNSFLMFEIDKHVIHIESAQRVFGV